MEKAKAETPVLDRCSNTLRSLMAQTPKLNSQKLTGGTKNEGLSLGAGMKEMVSGYANSTPSHFVLFDSFCKTNKKDNMVSPKP